MEKILEGKTGRESFYYEIHEWRGATENAENNPFGNLCGGGIAEGLDVGFVFLASGGFLVPDVLGFADEMDRDAAILPRNAVGVGFFPG